MEQHDNQTRALSKCTECGDERHEGGLMFFRRGGLPVCPRCFRNPAKPREIGDPRWDAAHAPLITCHV
jgi:hypothetical protein